MAFPAMRHRVKTPSGKLVRQGEIKTQLAVFSRTQMRIEEGCLLKATADTYVPDKNGQLRDVVLGFEKLDDYLPKNHRSDFGAIIGRYANRLCNGQITIDGRTYQLPQNDGQHCLHGGHNGWQYCLFTVEEVNDKRMVMSLVNSPRPSA